MVPWGHGLLGVVTSNIATKHMDYDYVGVLRQSGTEMWGDLMQFVPELLAALLVLLIGWLVADILKGLVKKLFSTFKVNEALDAAGVDELTKRAGYPLKAGAFVGGLVKWFVIAVFFVVALDILNLDQVTFFVRDVVLGFLPKVIVAVLILLVAMLVAKFASEAVAAGVRFGGTHEPTFFKNLTYYAIVTFAVLAALNQVDIAPELVQTLFTGIVFALALGLGLAFGLGGKEAAGRYINKMTEKNSNQ